MSWFNKITLIHKAGIYMSIRDAAFFKECEDKVAAMTESAFKMKAREMSAEKKAKASLRMKRELEIIINNGYSQEFYLLKAIVEHAIIKNKLMTIGGQISYSYVAYLLGISTLDPIERNYEVEMLLDYQHDRNPYMVVNAASDYKESLVAFLKGVFGKEMVSLDDLSIILGNRTCNIDCMSIGFIESYLVKLAEDIMQVSKSKSQGSFEDVRNRILCTRYPSGKISYENIVSVIKMLVWIINNEERPHSDKIECFALFDGTYDGLLRGLAAIRGSGIAEAELLDSNNNRILTRDGFYKIGLSLFGNEKDAYDFMNQIRMGHGRDCRYLDVLKTKGVSYDVLNKLKHVRYVVSEGSLIAEAQLVLYSGITLFQS